MSLKGKSIVSVRDMNKKEVEFIIDKALEFDKDIDKGKDLLKGKRVSILFFEDSTRTRTSFETAAHRLGAEMKVMAGAAGTSVKKGEPLLDTVRMYLGYGYNDCLIMRHPAEGSARYVAENIDCPVISGGDGAHEHPTQALLDYATIKLIAGNLDGVKIGRAGDLKHGRTVHSGMILDGYFGADVFLASPSVLKIPRWVLDLYNGLCGKTPVESESMEEILPNIQILYDTRIQKERFADENDYEKVKGEFVLTVDMLKNAQKGMKVLHPLPRCKHALEIEYGVDKTPHAFYFEQAAIGLPTRMALLASVVGNLAEGFTFDLSSKKEESDNLICELEIRRDPEEENRAKHYLLKRIESGTVIDHLRPGNALKALIRLGIYNSKGEKNSVYDGKYVGFLDDQETSKGPLKRKSIVKIGNLYLDKDQLTRIAIEFPEAVISYIDDAKVVKKFKVNIPSRIENQLKCPNTRCITHPNWEEGATTKFNYNKSTGEFQCHYCDVIVAKSDVELL